jgi:hypothetical protein
LLLYPFLPPSLHSLYLTLLSNSNRRASAEKSKIPDITAPAKDSELLDDVDVFLASKGIYLSGELGGKVAEVVDPF